MNAFALDPADTAPHDRPDSSNESQRNLIKLTPRKNVGPRASGNAFLRNETPPVPSRNKKGRRASRNSLASRARAFRATVSRLTSGEPASLAQHSLGQAVYATRHALAATSFLVGTSSVIGSGQVDARGARK
jgi:hypothetical protein